MPSQESRSFPASFGWLMLLSEMQQGSQRTVRYKSPVNYLV